MGRQIQLHGEYEKCNNAFAEKSKEKQQKIITTISDDVKIEFQ